MPSDALLKRLANTDDTIKGILASGGVAGATIAIAQSGEVIHEASYGYRDHEKRLKPDQKTIFGLGSISKSFTSAAVCILVEAGLLRWSTPIKQILPGLNSTDSAVTDDMTIHDLLSHQTGLSNMNEWWFGSDAVMLVRRDQELEAFNALRSAVGFRKKYHYNNWGYSLAGVVIEQLTGMRFADFLQQRVIEPLGLHSTTSKAASQACDNVAQPYAALDDGSNVLVPQPAIRDGTIMVPAQGVRSNAEDLLKWGQALLIAAAHEANSGEISTPGSPLKFVTKMISRQVTRKLGEFEQSYGLGFYRNELPTTFEGIGPNSIFTPQMPTISARSGHPVVVLHVGTMAGYYSYLTMVPELDTVMVILTNTIPLGDPAGWINQYLLEIIVDSPAYGSHDFVSLAKESASTHAHSYRELAKRMEKNRDADSPPRHRDAYIGRYKHPDRDWYIHINEHPSETNDLIVSFQGLESQTWALHHYQADTWHYLGPRDDEARRSMFTFADEDDHKLIFEADTTNNIVSVIWPMDPMISLTELRFWKLRPHQPLGNDREGASFGPE